MKRNELDLRKDFPHGCGSQFTQCHWDLRPVEGGGPGGPLKDREKAQRQCWGHPGVEMGRVRVQREQRTGLRSQKMSRLGRKQLAQKPGGR